MEDFSIRKENDNLRINELRLKEENKKLLYENEYLKEQLRIGIVSNQRELLAFLNWYDERMYHTSNKETALEVIKEYKANCC